MTVNIKQIMDSYNEFSIGYYMNDQEITEATNINIKTIVYINQAENKRARQNTIQQKIETEKRLLEKENDALNNLFKILYGDLF